jgi:release factor glutamine methyltransferase
MIISNPPYIPDTEVPNDPEVRDFDPREALYSGRDGLDSIREIASLSAVILKPGGTLLIEHSNLQGKEVREILQTGGFVDVLTGRDLAGRERFAEARRH